MKQLLALTVVIVILFACTTAIATTTETSKPATPSVIEYPTKLGMVTFDHNKHQHAADCLSCHHTGDHKKCKSCHGIGKETLSAKNAYHKQCKDCHNKSEQGPTKCKQCHIR